MADNELRRMNRTELIEIIYAQQQNERQLRDENEELHRELQYRKKNCRTLRATIFTLIVVVAAALVVPFFIHVLQISGSSMEPMLSDGDMVVLFKSGKLETGDLVAFYYQNELLLKRVIAVPGDTVDIDDEGNVYVNDVLLDEPYVTNKSLGETDMDYPYQVPDGGYFVMDDNRETSVDSRSSTVGCIEIDQIVGKLVLRIWPLKQLSFLN